MPTRNLVNCDQKMRKQKTDCFVFSTVQFICRCQFCHCNQPKIRWFQFANVWSGLWLQVVSVWCYRWVFFSFYRALFGLLLTLVVCVCVRACLAYVWLCDCVRENSKCIVVRRVLFFQFLSVSFAWQTQTTVSIRLDDSLGVCGLCMYVSTRGTNCYCCLLLVEEKE